MKKSPVVNLIMAACVILTMNGCSLFAPKTETIHIDSDPQGAEVVINDQHLVTPCSLSVPCNKDLAIAVRKDGYRTDVHYVGYTLGTCGFLDIVGTFLFLVPAVGLISSGAYTLNQHNIYVPLVKDTSK